MKLAAPPLLLALVLPTTAFADPLTLRDGETLLTAADRTTWLGHARCTCGEKLSVTLDLSALTSGSRVALVAGKSCITTDLRIATTCRTLWDDTVSSDRSVTVDVAADEVAGSCDVDTTLDLSLLVDAEDEDQWTAAAALELGVDTEAPSAPTGGSVTAGERLAEVAFEVDEDEDDATLYQVLCTTSSTGEPALDDPPEAGFTSAWDRCAAGDETLVAAHVCAEAQTGAASVTVTGLTNGIEYTFAVVAIDASGNASAPRTVGRATPATEEDLWERYQRSGGLASGTGCQAVGGGELAALALIAAVALGRKAVRS